jgi:translocation and assembly module TamB
LAEHEFEQVTVGVRVRGSARAPETTVTSSPSMSTAEALSWLLLGRPLNTASGSESQQISASALALSAGSGLLAQQLGAHLGLDSAGIVESRALGGSTLMVAKQISPRLFLSYGVSLIGSGQVLMLKYLLARGLNLSLESSKVETAGGINWHREK